MLPEHREYWDTFYASRVSAGVPVDPSPFGHWVQPQLAQGQVLIEVGFGNARDSLWFASLGHPVMGFDFAHSAVEHAQARAGELGLDATFAELDLYELGEVKAAGDAVLERPAPLAVYGRFLIHSLEDAGRENLLDLAARVLPRGGALFLEFRTGQDQGAEHVFGDDHYRQYLDAEVVAEEIRSRGGRITHLEAGFGLAPYKTEDPHVARIVATWSD